MVQNNVTPANLLVMYAWELLKANTDMVTINGLAPIGAVDDEPRLSEADAAYLIYGYSEQFSEGLRLKRRGILSLRVSARTVAEMNGILTVIGRTFENGDISAANVNLWSSTIPELIGIRFTTLDTTYIDGGSSSGDDGGPVYGLVNVRYEYVRADGNLKEFRLDNTGQAGYWS